MYILFSIITDFSVWVKVVIYRSSHLLAIKIHVGQVEALLLHTTFYWALVAPVSPLWNLHLCGTSDM